MPPFQINTYSYPGKILSVAGMLSRSFTKPQLQQNQLKHKQPPQQIDFAILQNGTLKPVRYLIPSKKHHHIKNMIHILLLLIMQQISFSFVLLIKVTTLLSNL